MGLRICINSQTPLVRFKLQQSELLDKYGELPDPVPLEALEEGEDYEFTPGGVPKILYPMIKRMTEEKFISQADWVSLNPTGPERMVTGNIMLHHVSMDPSDLKAYTRMKERLWQEVHNLNRVQVGPTEYLAYAKYNWFCATKMLELSPIDVFYIHDFQQLLTGSMIGLAGPTVLRWHIPLVLDWVDPYIRHFLVRCLETFDAIVVSCRRDLEGLIRAGYHGHAYQVYPPVDDRKWKQPPSSKVEEFCFRFGIRDDDLVVLNVGRMDPMKGQDVLVRAAPHVVRRFPKVKFVFVGDGSFTSSARGGLSHPKATLWRQKLQELARELNIQDNIKFTGYLQDEDLMAAYSRADVCVLSSRIEGFGLVVSEAWLYKKPVVVSSGAGAAELIIDGVNGYIFRSGNSSDLAEKLEKILANSELAIKLGQRGCETVRGQRMEEVCTKIKEILTQAVEGFKH